MTKAGHADAMAQYILHFKGDDFKYQCDKPHDGHVYYHAYAHEYGEEAAKQMLTETIEFREGA